MAGQLQGSREQSLTQGSPRDGGGSGPPGDISLLRDALSALFPDLPRPLLHAPSQSHAAAAPSGFLDMECIEAAFLRVPSPLRLASGLLSGKRELAPRPDLASSCSSTAGLQFSRSWLRDLGTLKLFSK